MADNFDFKKFLMENKLGAYSKAVVKEGMDSTAHKIARQAKLDGATAEDAAEELEVSGIDPIKAKMIVNSIYGEDLTGDFEMGDDDFGGDEPFGRMYEDDGSGSQGDALTDGEAIGGLVITPDKNDPKFNRIEFDVQGFTQNGSRQINYELVFFPATKRVTARNKKDSSGRTQSVEGILKGGGYVDLGTDNATVPSKIQNYLKKYAI